MGRPHLTTVKPPAKVYGAEPAQVGEFDVTFPDARVLKVKRFNTRRPGGCRYKVFKPDGSLLFDTNDCYDAGDAGSRLDDWIEAQWKQYDTPW